MKWHVIYLYALPYIFCCLSQNSEGGEVSAEVFLKPLTPLWCPAGSRDAAVDVTIKTVVCASYKKVLL